MSKTVDSATTEYVVDLAATLPVVISDTDALYLYGLDIIAEQLAGADRYYYVHDGLGSVRQLLDNTGQIAETYAYDPFGVPLAGGSVPNPYRFTGEAWDADVELLYLRARYYQPGTGRFVTKDPWRGDIREPGTLNGFVYVQNNAVNYTDPSGLWGPGAFPKPPLPDSEQIRDVAGTFRIPPELLGALLQTVVEIDYDWDDFLVDGAVMGLLLTKERWGTPATALLAEVVINALPEAISTGLAQMQYGTARGVENWLAQSIAENLADCEYLEMRERLPSTQSRSELAWQLMLPGRATVYAAAHLRQIMEYRFELPVNIAALSDEDMALVAALYNGGMYNSDITHYSHNKFGNYIINSGLLDPWRRRLGLASRWKPGPGGR